MRLRGLFCILLTAAWLAAPASAEVKLRGVAWQFAKPGPGRRFTGIDRLIIVDSKLKGKVRARLRLHNPGKEAEEAVLVRYSMTPKLKHPTGDWEAWGLPFMLDQRRIPKIKPGVVVEVSLDPTIGIKLYLKKVARWGLILEEVKLRVMLEPRRGETGKIQILESVLAVGR